MEPKKYRQKGEHPKTYAQRKAVIEGYLNGLTTAQVAKKLGVSTKRIHQIRHSAPYAEHYEREVRERRERTQNQLEALAGLALKVHLEIMQDAKHKQRLNAAEGVLDRLQATMKHAATQQNIYSENHTTFEGRTDEELEYYVDHGYWPDEAPK